MPTTEKSPQSRRRTAANLAHNPRTADSGRQKAEKPLSLNDISEFLNLTEDQQYERTVNQWRALALKLGHEGMRKALSGSSFDKRTLSGILVSAGISHDKGWARKESIAAMIAIPPSIQAAIVKSLGLGSSKHAPMVLPAPPLDTTTCAARLITDILSTPDVDIA